MYTNSIEYRDFLRHLAKMDSSTYPQFDQIEDEETTDEFLYDSNAMMNYLNMIYKLTKSNPLFMKLYSLAAEKMLSSDPEIGLAIMYSYDYLDLYFPFLCMFLQNENQELHLEFSYPDGPVDDSNSYYIKLIEFMTPKKPTYTTEYFPTHVHKI